MGAELLHSMRMIGKLAGCLKTASTVKSKAKFGSNLPIPSTVACRHFEVARLWIFLDDGSRVPQIGSWSPQTSCEQFEATSTNFQYGSLMKLVWSQPRYRGCGAHYDSIQPHDLKRTWLNQLQYRAPTSQLSRMPRKHQTSVLLASSSSSVLFTNSSSN